MKNYDFLFTIVGSILLLLSKQLIIPMYMFVIFAILLGIYYIPAKLIIDKFYKGESLKFIKLFTLYLCFITPSIISIHSFIPENVFLTNTLIGLAIIFASFLILFSIKKEKKHLLTQITFLLLIGIALSI